MMGTRRSFGEVSVPTIHRFGPYRVYFFAHENKKTNEPPHVHVRSGNGFAALWLSPVRVRDSRGYTPREIDRIRRIIAGNRELLLRHWHDFFDHAS
jgi:hypothetical protein